LDGQYEFLEAKILEASELINKSIKDSNLPEEVRIGAIVRKNKVIMPKSSVVFEKDDVVVFLSKRDQLKEIENLFRISS
jgi:trk system potassium uptake protein TrkA